MAAQTGLVDTADFVLTLDCPDAPGIVHSLSGILLEAGCDIVDNRQFSDRQHLRAAAGEPEPDGHFFMRLHFSAPAGTALESLHAALEPLARQHHMRWDLRPHGAKRRVLIMVSKFEHCLNDLLFRTRTGELPVEVVAVVSNHLDHQRLAEWHQIPFFHVPVTAETKPAAEARLMELVTEFDVELVVLARYMQVLSDDLTRRLEGRAINIHHSFLPAFMGANPYRQAYERGIKIIGATAHFVNNDLDEGPIIAQDVKEVNHSLGPADMATLGRDTEKLVLSKALKLVFNDRVFIQDNRTVLL